MQQNEFLDNKPFCYRVLFALLIFVALSNCSPNYESYKDAPKENPNGQNTPVEFTPEELKTKMLQEVSRDWGVRENSTQPSSADIENANFAELKFKFLDQKCLDCHSSKNPIRLVEYSEVLKNLRHIKRSLVSGSMPKQPKIFKNASLNQLKLTPASDEQIRMLRAWILAGAPNNGSPPEPDSSFASIKAYILNPKCNICHAGNLETGSPQTANSNGIPSDFPLFNEEYIWAQGLVLGETLSDPISSPGDETLPPPTLEERVQMGPIFVSLNHRKWQKRMPPPPANNTKQKLPDIEMERMKNWLVDLGKRKSDGGETK